MYQSSYQLLLIILPIISLPIVSKALGASGLGLYNYSSSIVNYFVLLAGLGLANYAVREISYVQNDKIKLSKKFWEIQFFNLFFSAIIFLAFLCFSLMSKNSGIFIAQSPIVFSTILDISWFFQGIEDFKKISIVNAIIKLVSFSFILIFINTSDDLIIYTLIQAFSILISAGAFWFFLRGKIQFVRVSLKEIWSHFLPSLNFFVLKIAATIFTNFNKTILGLLSTMTAVGIFSNSLVLVTMTSSLINTMNVVLLPRMSAIQKHDGEEKLIDTLKKSIHLQLFLTIPMMFGIIAVTPKMIPWFFGSEFLDMKYLVPIIAPIVVLQSIHQGIANQYLVPKNNMKSYNFTMIIGTVVNVIVGLALVPKFGQYGAAISFLIGQLALAYSRVRTLLKNTNFKFSKKEIMVYLLAGLLMVGIIYVGTNNMPSSPMTTVVQVMIGVTVYFAITILLKKNPILSLFRNR